MILEIIFNTLILFSGYSLGRGITALSIAKQIPENLDFKLKISWFGKTKVEIK